MTPEKLKVLFVEDDPFDFALTRDVMEKAGFVMEHAPTGIEAIQKLEGSRYDVLLTDLLLPDTTGIEVYRGIRRIQSDIVVVVLTGTGDQESAAMAIQEGVSDYLIKSPNRTHLKILPLIVKRAWERDLCRKSQEALQKRLEQYTKMLEKRADELESAMTELQEKTSRLSRFEKVANGREMAMIKLKQEVNELLTKSGLPKKYEAPESIQQREDVD